MKKLELNLCKKIVGGGEGITGTVISAFKDMFKTIFEIGENLGGALRRISSNKLCKF